MSSLNSHDQQNHRIITARTEHRIHLRDSRHRGPSALMENQPVSPFNQQKVTILPSGDFFDSEPENPTFLRIIYFRGPFSIALLKAATKSDVWTIKLTSNNNQLQRVMNSLDFSWGCWGEHLNRKPLFFPPHGLIFVGVPVNCPFFIHPMMAKSCEVPIESPHHQLR